MDLLAKLINHIVLVIARSKALKLDIVKLKKHIIICCNEKVSEVAIHY